MVLNCMWHLCWCISGCAPPSVAQVRLRTGGSTRLLPRARAPPKSAVAPAYTHNCIQPPLHAIPHPSNPGETSLNLSRAVIQPLTLAHPYFTPPVPHARHSLCKTTKTFSSVRVA